MSTLVVSNISDGTTTVGASYVTNGSAKAWVNFNGTGTIAARDSLNLSSLTDNGTGNYTITFSSAFGAADYCGVVSCGEGSASPAGVNARGPAGGVFSTSTFQVRVNDGGSLVDAEFVFSSNNGDLA